MFRVFVVSLLVVIAAVVADAHPVSFKGATSLMSYNKEGESELQLAYSVTSKFAVAANYIKLEESSYSLARVNYLLQRWNNEESQGNIYLSAGYGVENTLDEKKGVGLVSVDADWESRKYYIASQYTRLLRDNISTRSDVDYEMSKLRLGVAPYLAEFHELNTWFIVQFDKQNDQSIQTTQFIRLFYKNALIELGANLSGGWAFNYMIHF